MPFGEALLPGENTAGSNQREILTMEDNSMTESKASPEETESGALPVEFEDTGLTKEPSTAMETIVSEETPVVQETIEQTDGIEANILSNGGPPENENDSRDVKCREQRRESISNTNEEAQPNNQEVEIKTGTDTTKSSISDTMDTGDNQKLGPRTKQTTPAATKETDDEVKNSKVNQKLDQRTKQTTPAAAMEKTNDEAKNSKVNQKLDQRTKQTTPAAMKKTNDEAKNSKVNQELDQRTKQTTPAAMEKTNDEAKNSKVNQELDQRTKQTTPGATEETDDEAKNSKDIGVYKRRWYVLAVFCLFSFTQACVWNTFGPISSTTEEAFGWTDGTIALFSNWGPIGYILAAIPFSWMLDVKGLRWSCVFSACLVLVGTALRCITMHTPTVTWLIHVGHFLNGVAGPVAMGGPPAVSAVWFPLHERATATAIGTACNYLGVAVAFILGPNIVHSYKTVAQNTTDVLLGRSGDEDGQVVSVDYVLLNLTGNDTDAADIGRERDEVLFYMYIEVGWCGALFLLLLVYFPKKPPLPPCVSAAVQREDFLVGLKHLLTQKQFWVVALVYGVSFGVVNSWASVLNISLSPLGISEQEAGWIGFYSILAGCVLCLVIARFADTFARVMKQFIIGLYLTSTIFFIIFALAAIKIVPSYTVIFYVTIIGGMTSLTSAVPLIFELACELAFPTGEGTTNVVLTTICNIGGLLFLFVEMIPNIGSLWMNWTLVGALGLCLPMWVFLKENYNRLAVDEINPSLAAINTEIIVKPDQDLELQRVDVYM